MVCDCEWHVLTNVFDADVHRLFLSKGFLKSPQDFDGVANHRYLAIRLHSSVGLDDRFPVLILGL